MKFVAMMLGLVLTCIGCGLPNSRQDGENASFAESNNPADLESRPPNAPDSAKVEPTARPSCCACYDAFDAFDACVDAGMTLEQCKKQTANCFKNCLFPRYGCNV